MLNLQITNIITWHLLYLIMTYFIELKCHLNNRHFIQRLLYNIKSKKIFAVNVSYCPG